MGFLDSLKKAASAFGIETPNIDELVDKAVDKARSTVSELGVDVDRISSMPNKPRKKPKKQPPGWALSMKKSKN